MVNNRVLMIAFHFPPLQGSSGIQRTFSFARYLPEFGWDPIILTVRPFAYEKIENQQPVDMLVPSSIHRTFAFDAARHFAFAEKYPAMLARPDRWISWWLSAVPAGIRLVRKLKPRALWSTYPLATAHVIGSTLHRATGLPWLADFRDPMAQEGYPTDSATWRMFKRIEERAISSAKFSIFTAPGAAHFYRERYADKASTMTVIENGFDEEAFAGITSRPGVVAGPGTPLLLVHSGIVYPAERDPSKLFAALRSLCDGGRLRAGDILIRFRAPVHVDLIRRLAESFDVATFIEIAQPLPYREALREMCDADGLVILQGANCNQQIPAKLYEYLRAGRPVLGLADPMGDTAASLRAAGVRHIAALEDEVAISNTIERFIADLRGGDVAGPDPSVACAASRRERTRQLAGLLDRAILP